MQNLIQWQGHTWETKERWGEIHPGKRYCYYDPTAVEIKNGNLVLKTHYNPKSFTIDGQEFVSNIGIGLVSNTTHLSYGYYEIEAKLPSGKHLWPAFWMYAFESHPPEIDILEAYTKNKKGYFNPFAKSILGIWQVETNVHYGFRKDNTYKMTGGKTHWFGLKNPAKRFIKYGLLWEPSKIVFFYNGLIVRKITNKEVLKYFDNVTMNVIINNHVDSDVDVDNPPVSEFIIKSFKHEPF